MKKRSTIRGETAAHAVRMRAALQQKPPLYTPEQKRRRDETAWTLVQGVLAPVQFLVFLASLFLVLRFLMTGEGFAAATISVMVKTLVLYAIMITGAIWEKKVFGVYLFAPAFYWEDVFSMAVIALHTLYVAMVAFGWGNATEQMFVALAAYATYVINATQFLLKLRAARLQSERSQSDAMPAHEPRVGTTSALSQGAD